jgi:predicted  nucleic acid-binding Zn-ribbon protein
MAAITFPSSPSVNQVHTVGDRSWKFNGAAWKLVPRTTDAIVEGSTNKYYTDARVAAAPAVTALETRASAIESDISDIETAAGTLSGRVTTAEGDIDALETRAGTIESAATTLSGRVTTAEGNISTLTSGLATEKGRVDAILSAADADKDSFAEIVSLINSVDTANDNAFAGYVTSNNAAVEALDGRLDTAESDINALETRAGTIESAATTLSGRVTTAEGDIDALESRATSIEGAATTLAGRVTTAEGTLSSHVAATNNPHSVTKAQVGLGNADNTSDADKPVSTAQQTALNGKQIKDVISTTAPSHVEGLRWIDSADMTEYVSYGGAWVELDKQ